MKKLLKTLYINVLQVLFPDAEFGEDGLEDVGGGDFAGDFAEVVEDAADILA